eukprot:m.67919 g.67919  ORF g.67919 m.67919 type:complete len:228 (-) comp12180_c0_seq3:3141-3824(-)
MGGENVQVAVRVRPFNDREKQRKAVLCIKMEGKQTTIFRQHEGKKEERKFTFDYSYWSHDGYKETPEQLLVPVGANYADQAKVFDDLGVGVLNNAFEGYNASLFAYGQTGSGKSYSMVCLAHSTLVGTKVRTHAYSPHTFVCTQVDGPLFCAAWAHSPSVHVPPLFHMTCGLRLAMAQTKVLSPSHASSSLSACVSLKHLLSTRLATVFYSVCLRSTMSISTIFLPP